MKKAKFSLLPALLLLFVLISCSSGEGAVQDIADTAADTTADVITEESGIKPDIPADVRYDGYEFK